MPLDALGRTRATMPGTAGVYPSPRGAGNPLKALLSHCVASSFGAAREACLGLELAIFLHKRGMPSSGGSLSPP